MTPTRHGRVRLALILGGIVAAAALAAAACGGGGDDSSGSTPAATQGGGGSSGGGAVILDWTMGDNFFEQAGQKNPTIEVSAGASVTVNLENKGTAIHNMRFAGEDNTYNNADDAVSDPNLLQAGQKAVLKFTAPKKAGTYNYQCDFHPTDMKGTVVVK